MLLKHNMKAFTGGLRIFLAVLLLIICEPSISANTMVQTSFEEYNLGDIKNQDKWEVLSASGEIFDAESHSGDKALKAKGKFNLSYSGWGASETGLAGLVYFDMYINVKNMSTGKIYARLYDRTPKNSTKRAFEIELQTPDSDGLGKIKLTSSPSKTISKGYKIGEWFRISACVDLEAEKIKLAVNGSLIDGEYNLRESWDPKTLGRESGIKEIHYLNIETNDANTEVIYDDIYIGNSPIGDVSFGEISEERTVKINQPTIGTITIEPQKDIYVKGDIVKFICTMPKGYKLASWTNDLSGKENPLEVTIEKNLTVGADVVINEQNPPAKYTLTVIPTDHASFKISPESADNTYYEGSEVTITVSPNPCYQFDGWTGDASGVDKTISIIIDSEKTIGANISVYSKEPTTYHVKTATEFKKALDKLNPGDVVVVADGVYDLGGQQTISIGGCEDYPILITAENIGGAELTGKSAFTLRDVDFVTIRGFVFTSIDKTAVKMESSRYCRVTQNEFRLNETTSNKWIVIGAHYEDTYNRSWSNRIDHNLFTGKTMPGNYITIDGVSSAHEPSQYDMIDHNHFKNNSPRANNEKETIRVGWTELSGGNSYTNIEYNLFEDCDGDPEIVSIKSCYNTIRHNTFRRCLGTVCLRQGAYNTVDGNFFFGEKKTAESDGRILGCGGVRVYGIGHVVVNNYFEGLTGSMWDAAFALTNGDKANGGDLNNNSHLVPENIIFAHNTLINNLSDIEVGYDNNGKYSKKPMNCTIANNIFINDNTNHIKFYTAAHKSCLKPINNIIWLPSHEKGDVEFKAEEASYKNPGLLFTNKVAGTNQLLPNAVYKIQTNSPALMSANRLEVCQHDFEGQLRDEKTSIGADDISTSKVKSGVIDESHVGPNAIEFKLEEDSMTSINEILESDSVELCYDKNTNSINIKNNSSATHANVAVYNSVGQCILKRDISLNQGNNMMILPQSAYCNLLLVRVTADKVTKILKYIQ